MQKKLKRRLKIENSYSGLDHGLNSVNVSFSHKDLNTDEYKNSQRKQFNLENYTPVVAIRKFC